MENTGLNDTQRDTLKDWFQSFCDARSPYPNLNMQTRVRLDGQAVIFEAPVNTDNLDKDHVVGKLAEVFGIDPATITVVVRDNQYGEGADLQRPAGTNRLRFGVFGGRGATWAESRDACAQYLSDFAEDWEQA